MLTSVFGLIVASVALSLSVIAICRLKVVSKSTRITRLSRD